MAYESVAIKLHNGLAPSFTGEHVGILDGFWLQSYPSLFGLGFFAIYLIDVPNIVFFLAFLYPT